jgi:hypothetical protein
MSDVGGCGTHARPGGGTRVVTRDLVPGGSAISVSTANQVAYVYTRADDRLRRQLEPAARAFAQGVYAVLEEHWLATFSAPELQRLMAGDDTDLGAYARCTRAWPQADATRRADWTSLQRYVVYAGGYHRHHRVIRWLWQVRRPRARPWGEYARPLLAHSLRNGGAGARGSGPPGPARLSQVCHKLFQGPAGPCRASTVRAWLIVPVGRGRAPLVATAFWLCRAGAAADNPRRRR